MPPPRLRPLSPTTLCLREPHSVCRILGVAKLLLDAHTLRIDFDNGRRTEVS